MAVNEPLLPQHEQFRPVSFPEVNNSPQDPAAPSIHALNDDCIDNIFAKLDFIELILEIRLVCRRWYNGVLSVFSRTDKLDMWDYILEDGGRWLNEGGAITALKLTQGNVKHLVLCGSYVLGYRDSFAVMFSAVAAYCPNLEVLDLSHIQVLEWEQNLNYSAEESPLIDVISEEAPGIVALKDILARVTRVKLYPQFPDACLDMITKNAKNLEAIDFGAFTKTTGEFINKNLLKNAMKHFSFRRCENLLPSTLEFVLKQYSSTMEFLDLAYCEQGRTTDFCETNIGPFLKMREFRFGGLHHHATEHALKHGRTYEPWNEFCLLQLMPNLKVLHLEYENHDFRVTPRTYLSHVAGFCPKIEELSICNEKGFESNLESLAKFKSLKKLELFSVDDTQRNVMCVFVSSSGDQQTSDDALFRSVLAQLKTLEHLKLFWFILDDQSLFDIISTGFVLSRLDLRYSYFNLVTGKFIEMCKSLDRYRKIEIVLPRVVWDMFLYDFKKDIPSFLVFSFVDTDKEVICVREGKVRVFSRF